MLFRLFLALILLSSCLNIGSIEKATDQYCGFDTVNSLASLESIQCDDRVALCPTQPSQPLQTDYCSVSYKRAPGFWFECAPLNDGPVCQAELCKDKVIAPPASEMHFPLMCESMYFSAFAFGSSQSDIKKYLGNNIKIGRTPKGDVRYLYYFDNNEIWVAFSGSVTTCNWLADLDHQLVNSAALDGMPLHRGFLESASSAIDEIEPLIKADLNRIPARKLYVTGHSLGAGVATIFSLLLAKDGIKPSGTITFAQPQVTNETGTAYYNERGKEGDSFDFGFLRVIHRKDIVPYSLEVIDIRYDHFGPELRLETETNSNKTILYDFLLKPDGGRFPAGYDHTILTDHLPDLYLDTIKSMGCTFIRPSSPNWIPPEIHRTPQAP